MLNLNGWEYFMYKDINYRDFLNSCQNQFESEK